MHEKKSQPPYNSNSFDFENLLQLSYSVFDLGKNGLLSDNLFVFDILYHTHLAGVNWLNKIKFNFTIKKI